MGHDPHGWLSLEWPVHDRAVHDRAGCVHDVADYSSEADEGWLESDSKFGDLTSADLTFVEPTLADSTWVGRNLGAFGSLVGVLVGALFGRVRFPPASLIQWTSRNDGYC